MSKVISGIGVLMSVVPTPVIDGFTVNHEPTHGNTAESLLFLVRQKPIMAVSVEQLNANCGIVHFSGWSWEFAGAARAQTDLCVDFLEKAVRAGSYTLCMTGLNNHQFDLRRLLELRGWAPMQQFVSHRTDSTCTLMGKILA